MNNMHMDQYTHNAFWLEDRITVTFQLGPDATPIPQPGGTSSGNIVTDNEMTAREGPPPTFDKASAINALRLRELNEFLDKSNYPILNTIDFTDTLRTSSAIPPANPEQIGKYLFTSKNDQGQYVPTVICFFKFDSMAMRPGNGPANDTKHNDSNDNDKGSDDPVVNLVNFINRQDTLENLRNHLNVPLVSASPTWLTGGSPYAPVGCPLSPPIPLPGDARCSSSPGLWPIRLPELSTDLERMTGDGVHVIILDTLPRQEDIMRIVEGAEEHNLLLLDVVNNVVMHHNLLPVGIDEPNPKQPKTGKDIKGRNGGGFRMADHGLFIAGIVRDVAPDAHVECIRALNDFCAGESSAFVKALESVENRMLLVNPDDNNKQGDLYQKQVVINLSCVVPPDDYLQMLGIQLGDVRADLIKPIKALVDLEVLFVASAGNEGDTRYQPANPSQIRPDALYPAAFAYNGIGTIKALGNSIIPVGAVDKYGNPTIYSCYPGDLGIATYGGDVPKHFKQDESGCFTIAEELDAVVGIYTSLSYPALLLEDCRPTYPIPNSHAWAYWCGTSFATPIITGLVARIMQYKLENPSALIPPNVNINQTLTNIGTSTHQITWDRLNPGFHSDPGQMILAVQKCSFKDRDDDDEKRERVEVHVTIKE